MTQSLLLMVDEAVALVLHRAKPLPSRLVPLADSVGLILAESVVADIDLPPFTKALMDGYAVRSTDLPRAGEHRLRVVAEVAAGQTADRSIEPGEAARIMTGAPLPEGTDAVINVERTRIDPDDPNQVLITTSGPTPPGQFRLDRGREMRRGETLLGPGITIRPTTVGLIASAGRGSVRVIPKPSVGVVPTGDELVPVEQTPGSWQIRNTNGPILAAMARDWGASEVFEHPSVADRPEVLAEVFGRELLERDVLLISGGVSAGIKDLVPSTLVEVGVKPVFHKVAVKPGKPIWFGVGPPRSKDRPGTLVFGLPGNPASGVVGFLLFVRPAMDVLAGRGSNASTIEKVRLGTTFHHRGDRPTYHPVRVEGDRVFPLDWAGSADLRTVALADGFAAFASGDHVYEVGDAVGLLRFR